MLSATALATYAQASLALAREVDLACKMGSLPAHSISALREDTQRFISALHSFCRLERRSALIKLAKASKRLADCLIVTGVRHASNPEVEQRLINASIITAGFAADLKIAAGAFGVALPATSVHAADLAEAKKLLS